MSKGTDEMRKLELWNVGIMQEQLPPQDSIIPLLQHSSLGFQISRFEFRLVGLD